MNTFIMKNFPNINLVLSYSYLILSIIELISILYCFLWHNYAIIMPKKGVKYHATYYAY